MNKEEKIKHIKLILTSPQFVNGSDADQNTIIQRLFAMGLSRSTLRRIFDEIRYANRLALLPMPALISMVKTEELKGEDLINLCASSSELERKCQREDFALYRTALAMENIRPFNFLNPRENYELKWKKRGGSIWTFGWGAGGQLGHGNEQSKYAPTRIESLREVKIVAVAAGDGNTVVLDTEGGVWTFGYGGHGQLGHRDEQSKNVPTRIESLRDIKIVAVAAGGDHTVVLDAEGGVWTFGYGGEGRLGHGDAQNKNIPTRIESLRGVKIVAVAAGAEHTVVLDAEGGVWTFGLGGDGELGHGDTQNKNVPTRIESLREVKVIAIAAGGFHTVLLDTQGGVWTFGYGGGAQLGHGDEVYKNVPTRIEGLREVKIVAVSAGEVHTVVLDAQGNVWTFGYGETGKLGHGDNENKNVPTRIEGLRDVKIVEVAAGSFHTVLIDAQGGVWTFGLGEDGRLGHGNEQSKNVPTRIQSLRDIKIVTVAAGAYHTVLISLD